jgi:TetR/AcrR family transcriptional regulator, fatty acid metabolism regulator protein
MRTDRTPPPKGTFTQTTRRAQLVDCAVDALAEVGYQQSTVAEVARRAGVSKGVVTYYFPARDELVWAVVTAIFTSVGEHVGSRLGDVPPVRFVATYLEAWVDYFRTYRREMMAIADIWTSFRDADGRPHLDARTLNQERILVETALAAGQTEGTLGDFSPRVVAVTLKAALDGLLSQLAIDPDLDLDAYRDELIALFDRATRPAARLPRLALVARHPERQEPMRFSAETSSNGVIERDFTVGEVTGVLWSPVSGSDHAPLVLMGHGGAPLRDRLRLQGRRHRRARRSNPALPARSSGADLSCTSP